MPMQQAVDGPISIALPAGEDFLDRLAAAMLTRCADFVERGDLSSVLIIVPALPLAADLRAALLRAAPRPLLLPRFDTLRRWIAALPLAGGADPLPDSERLVLLHEALRQRGWFDETALWGIAGEMAALFDELSRAATDVAGALPDDEAALIAQLQRAYELRASVPLAFEARVVHELWRALAASGQADAQSAYRLRLSAAARHFEHERAGLRPLLVLLDASPAESLAPAESEFLWRYARIEQVSLFHPALRGAATSPLLETLAAAWTEEPAAPLIERARELALQQSASPLGGRLQLVPAEGAEQEAQAAVAQIAAWLSAGLKRIVLIAQDRLTARRVRALLEREAVLVSDETGWKLSTSRAAAAVDALLETAAGGAYYRDLLELCKSPYVFADCQESERKAAVFTLEAALRTGSVKSGLPRMRKALAGVRNEFQAGAKELALSLLARIDTATTLLNARATTLPRWLDRLSKALEAVGALEPLRQDAAGQALLELLRARRDELDKSTALFSFVAWRDWLNREFEAATFRDAGISSTIVLTPLNAVGLRRFDAALLLGGDVRQLAPAAGGTFFNDSVRRELGLPTRADSERELRRTLALLLAGVPRVTITWQTVRDGEANLLAPELALLATLHQLAWGDNLQRAALPARAHAAPHSDSAPQPAVLAAPVAPVALIPQRVSVSGYASLVACPYRFFARHVLRLGELDEVSEDMDKSDYGALVHRVLERFHSRHPVLADLSDEHALSTLQDCVAEVFAPAVDDNFLAIGWRLKWERQLLAYLDWQRQREAEGWRWAQAETRASRVLPLEGSESVELYGRIDRIDTLPGGGAALLDYKTQTAKLIRERLADDVQLPAYALLHGDAVQAAYVALDDQDIVAVSAGAEQGDLTAAAQAQGRRLQTAFAAMRAGAKLPAHGVDRVCRWCEMSGLCRKDYV